MSKASLKESYTERNSLKKSGRTSQNVRKTQKSITTKISRNTMTEQDYEPKARRSRRTTSKQKSFHRPANKTENNEPELSNDTDSSMEELDELLGIKETRTSKSKEISTEELEEDEEDDSKKSKKRSFHHHKKNKEKVEKVVVETEAPRVTHEDIQAQIQLLKKSILQPETIEKQEEVELPEKKKRTPPPKKKKREKKLTQEQQEKLRLEQEQAEKERKEEERIRLENERIEEMAKEKREMTEQKLREQMLQKTCGFIEELIDYNTELEKKAREESEWDLYVNCKYLPIPSQVDQMNRYLHLWELDIDDTSVEDCSKRTSDVMKLLADLDDLIETVLEDYKSKLENWKWVKTLYRQHQELNLDITTYRLLRNIRFKMEHLDITIAYYDFCDEFVQMSIWLRKRLPIPIDNPRRAPKPQIEITFKNLDMTVLFPLSIDGENAAIRVMHLNYDHLSDLSQQYADPKNDYELENSLQEYCLKHFVKKLEYKFINRTVKMKELVVEQDDENIADDVDEDAEKVMVEVFQDLGFYEGVRIVPYSTLSPSAAEFAQSVENSIFQANKAKFSVELAEDVINIRKYTILGGVYYMNLLEQPPQPHDFVTVEMNVTPLYLPKELKYMDFYEEYKPPPPPEPRSTRKPEDIEEEMKKQEEAMEKLMLVNLSWPKNVIFIELPLICQWNPDECTWSKKDIHDLKPNEEKATISFRTGCFGVFAFASLRYANLPHQAWDIKPDKDDSIIFQLTTAILMLEFNIKDGLIALTQLQNSPNEVLQDQIGIYYKFHVLQRIMKQAGVDVFPANDVFNYVEAGSCEKHWVMEKHLYFCMACVCCSFHFSWSRWNLPAGFRKIVMQMREYRLDKEKQKPQSMLLVTPFKACVIDCTEVSQTFCEDDLFGSKFYPDLLTLVRASSSTTVRNALTNVSKENIYAVAKLLIGTKFLSLS